MCRPTYLFIHTYIQIQKHAHIYAHTTNAHTAFLQNPWKMKTWTTYPHIHTRSHHFPPEIHEKSNMDYAYIMNTHHKWWLCGGNTWAWIVEQHMEHSTKYIQGKRWGGTNVLVTFVNVTANMMTSEKKEILWAGYSCSCCSPGPSCLSRYIYTSLSI